MKAKGILITISCILALVAVGMAFLPAFQFGDTETTYTGLQAALGYTETTEVLGATISNEVLKMNLLSTLQYALPIVGIIIALIAGKSRLAGLIGFIVFAGAGVAGYFATGTFPEALVGLNDVATEVGSVLGTNWEQTIPSMISMGASAGSALMLLFRSFVK